MLLLAGFSLSRIHWKKLEDSCKKLRHPNKFGHLIAAVVGTCQG